MNVGIRDAVAVAVRTGPRTALVRIREVSGTAALYAVLGAILFTVTTIRLLEKHVVQIQVAPTPQVPTDWRPPIKDCPDDVALWDCIRHAMYREDI